METIKSLKEQMKNEFNELLESIGEFQSEPLIRNKKKVKEKMASFNYKKNKLSSAINDFWCKYE